MTTPLTNEKPILTFFNKTRVLISSYFYIHLLCLLLRLPLTPHRIIEFAQIMAFYLSIALVS